MSNDPIKDRDAIIHSLLTALIDTDALLEHYASGHMAAKPISAAMGLLGRKLNWDGSTKSQAIATVKVNRAIVACVRDYLAKQT